jgi:hypothetical protein
MGKITGAEEHLPAFTWCWRLTTLRANR